MCALRQRSFKLTLKNSLSVLRILSSSESSLWRQGGISSPSSLAGRVTPVSNEVMKDQLLSIGFIRESSGAYVTRIRQSSCFFLQSLCQMNTCFFISIINFKNRLNYAYFQTRLSGILPYPYP